MCARPLHFPAANTAPSFTSLRFLEGDVSKCLQTAIRFERETISQAPNAEVYNHGIGRKLNEITQKRNQNGGGMMNGNGPQMGPGHMSGDPSMNQNGGHMAQRVQQQQQQQQQTPNMAAQQGQMPNAMNQLGAPSMQPSMSQSSHQQQPQMNATPNPQQGSQLPPPTQQEIQEAASRLMASIPEEKRQNLRAQIMRSMNEQQRQQHSSAGRDPLAPFLMNKARQDIMARRAAQANGGQPQQNMQMANAGGVNMAQAGSQQGNSFDFTAIMGQQANAMRQQESGEQVVPASNNPNAGFKGPVNQQNAQSSGINPAMLGNGGGNGQAGPQMPNGMTQQQMQQMIMQQREKQRQQEQMRRNQAMQQMHGQNMGAQNALNGAAGGSPAMTMLNRPMQPPGSQTPNTPQQPNRAPNMQQPGSQHGQTPVNGPNGLMQQHQNMVNRGAAGSMQGPLAGLPHNPIFENPQAMTIIRTMPPQVLEKLRNTATRAPADLPNFIKQWALAHKQRTQNQASQMGGPQMGNQGGMNGIPPNGMPDMNMQQAMMAQGQPQIPPGMDPAQLQARMQQHQQQQQQQRQQQQQQNQMQQLPQIPPNFMERIPPQMKSQAMYLRPFPPQVLAQLGLAVPPHIRIWGHLKNHVEQNVNSLQPGTLNKFSGLMGKWFQDHPEEFETGVKMALLQRQQQQQNQQPQQMNGQNVNPGGQPNGNNLGNGMGMPGAAPGGAPTAQMMQPNPQMQAGPGPGPMMGQQGQMRMPPQPPIGPNDIAMFRQRIPQGSTMSDDQIRHVMEQSRRKSMATQNNALKQAQMHKQLAQNNAAGQANQQARPPSRTPAQPSHDQVPPAPQQQAGQKRAQPANDDVMEIPNPNAQPAGQSQTNKARPTGPLAGMKLPNLTSDALSKMTPEQRDQLMRRYESLRQVNAGAQAAQAGMPPAQVPNSMQQSDQRNNAGTEADPAKIVQRLLEEVNRNQAKGAPVQQDAAATEETKAILKKIYSAYTHVDKTFIVALRLPDFNEDQIKELMKAKIQIFHNWDAQNGGVKGHLSINLQQAKYMQSIVSNYLSVMNKARQRGQINQQAAQQAQQQSAKPQAEQASAMEKTASKHGRKTSSSKPPPAPTDNKTFDWGVGVASPHGIPKYESGPSQLTPDKLKFPPNKRRRTGQPESAGSTPAGQAGTPSGASPGAAAAKPVSPEQVRKVQLRQEAEEREKKRWKCAKDPACEASIEGFETEEQLKTHFESVHKEIENPLQFLLDSAAETLGVDLDGKPLPGKSADKPKPGARLLPPKAAPMKRDPSLTSHLKPEVRTPAGQVITPATPGSGNKGSAAGAKPADKQASASTESDKPKTLHNVLAEKMGYQPAIVDEDTPSTATLSADDQLWADIGSTVASGLATFDPFNFDSTDSVQIDDWGLRPEHAAVEGLQSSPDTTPETDRQSSRSSDVSANDRLRINMEWDAFGNGDTAVPEMLSVANAVDFMGLDSSDKDKSTSDEKKADDDKNKVADPFDWSADSAMTWEGLFTEQEGGDMLFGLTNDGSLNASEVDFVF